MLGVSVCVCVSACVRAFTSAHVQGVQGAHSGSKYCVYQHNESSERETEREREQEIEGGWKGGRRGESHFPDAVFFLPFLYPPTHHHHRHTPPPVVPLPSFPVFCLLPLFA